MTKDFKDEMMLVSLNVKLFTETKALIDEKVKAHPKLYDNASHFIRCAITRELKRAC